ncbi:MAG TPA: VanZ family protein [Kutzneria sp.]|nr:VanZ family protein [Kutzneria sp.]
MLKDWHDWFETFTGVVALWFVTFPVAVLAVLALAWWRRTWRTALADVGMVYGTLFPVWLTLLPGGPGTDPPRVSLVPFTDLSAIIEHGPASATIQIGGNLILLAALGFFAPLRFPALASLPRILVLAAVCSTLIETAQYVFHLDRVSSVDDVLVNTAGAGLAALASRHWWRVPVPISC